MTTNNTQTQVAESFVLRHPKYVEKDLYLDEDGKWAVMRDIIAQSANLYPDLPCMGRRRMIKLHHMDQIINGETKKMELPELTPVEWKTYREVMEMITNFAGNLISLTGMGKGSKLGIYLDTSMEWQIISQACYRHGIIICTCYANLGEESLVHVVEECELDTIVVGSKNVKNLERLKDQLKSLKRLIIVRDLTDDKPLQSNVFNFSTFDELVSPNHPEPELPPLIPEDPAVIMYTSGSTGVPKGVVAPNRSLIASSGAASAELSITKDDMYIGYLPLAHILELVSEEAFFMRGGSIGYGTPRTLTAKGVGPIDDHSRQGDLEAIRPTMMAGVPRVYGTIMKGALEQVEQGSFLKRWLFSTALSRKKDAISKGSDTPFWNWLVFRKLREKLGGRIRLMLSGGAPLSKELQEFLHAAFCCIVVQGYGLTETSGGGVIQDPGLPLSTERIGYPFYCSEIKLVSVPDMGYHANANPPKGEIWIRGNNVTLGYYKQEDKTREAFTDGWFRTGDVGTFNSDGTISIIDRIKNLIKLANGEYVAVESLEMLYSGSPFIAAGSICVYADSFRDCCVAIALPQESYCKTWANEKGLSNLPLKDLYSHPTFKEAVLENLREIGKSNNKKTFELISDITVVNDVWGPENGTTTASLKLNRSNIAKIYEADIERMYKSISSK